VVSLIEICSPADPLLLPWLDLYETAFPPGERILVSRVLNVLHEKQHGNQSGMHLLAAVEREDTPPGPDDTLSSRITNQRITHHALCGIIFDYEPPARQAAFLWYLAVAPWMRGQGLGSWLYHQVLSRFDPSVRAMIFDLEDPREMHTPEEKEIACRRIQFYRRQGARLLGGIRYMQTVGTHMPPIPLLLMAHPIQEISPHEAFGLAEEEFGGSILQQVGELKWEEVTRA
jgi:GNAT superfamily N-acetyltransferase